MQNIHIALLVSRRANHSSRPAQTFTRFVQIGRVAYIAFGPDEGKLVAIVDVVDQSRVLVDGPCSGVGRKIMNLKFLHLTKFVLKFAHSARARVVRKVWEAEKINEKWAESTWAKKIESRHRRANLTDFDRYKLMKAKQARNRLINIQFGKLRNAHKKNLPPKGKKVSKK